MFLIWKSGLSSFLGSFQGLLNFVLVAERQEQTFCKEVLNSFVSSGVLGLGPSPLVFLNSSCAGFHMRTNRLL